MEDAWKFAQPAGSDVEMFIQWKGTTVCLDLHCPCGHHSHIDDKFAYYVGCPKCGAVYEMGTQVVARRRPDLTLDDHVVLDVSEWFPAMG